MPLDIFKGNQNITAPLESAERADFSATDHTFKFVTRSITCSVDGTLVVDTPNQTEHTIQVFAGWNDIRISKIYNSGSDSITVDGWV